MLSRALRSWCAAGIAPSIEDADGGAFQILTVRRFESGEGWHTKAKDARSDFSGPAHYVSELRRRV